MIRQALRTVSCDEEKLMCFAAFRRLESGISWRNAPGFLFQRNGVDHENVGSQIPYDRCNFPLPPKLGFGAGNTSA
jgi:hypothetical protein